jgi:ribose 5-phosphate isomerase A
MTQDALKQAAAEKALELVRDGMLVGLGSGSTVAFFTEGLGKRVAAGLHVRGVPTSRATAGLAASNGIPVVEEFGGKIDLTVDGADEVDGQLGLIKGRGGALFREKLVAASSKRFVVVVDESKIVEHLGVGALPVEVLAFMWRMTAARLETLGATWTLRGGAESPYVTDNGNLILDLSFDGGIRAPEGMSAMIKQTTGVVEHGLFLGMASSCIVAGSGGVRVLGEAL